MRLTNAFVFLSLALSAVAQSVVNPPPGIGPGQPYRILFVTDGARSANSSDIAVYDTFVTNQAAADPGLAAIGTNWRALASTDAVDARDHTQTTWTAGDLGVPIYRPDGVLIAADYQSLWSAGSSNPLANEPWSPFNSTSQTNNRVWTGTYRDGTAAGYTLGDSAGQSMSGDPESTSLGWTYANNWNSSVQWPLYGLSDVLVQHTAQYPAGLEPGDQYRIMFVTDTTRDATSSNIADYDAFVTADAMASPELLALGTNWLAVASTPTAAAKGHTQTQFNVSQGNLGVPIFRPDGLQIAEHYRHLWQVSSYGALLNPPKITASGAITTHARTWTGTNSNGSKYAFDTLGDPSGTSAVGQPSAPNYSWVNANYYPQAQQRPLFGMSGVLTVPYPHTQTIRPGTPANSNAFLPGPNLPLIGQSWMPAIDHTTFAINAALDFAFFGAIEANVPVPGLGTVLVDNLLGSMSVAPGVPFDLTVASDPTLLGVQLSVQGLTLDWNWQLFMTNAIDITIGSL